MPASAPGTGTNIEAEPITADTNTPKYASFRTSSAPPIVYAITSAAVMPTTATPMPTSASRWFSEARTRSSSASSSSLTGAIHCSMRCIRRSYRDCAARGFCSVDATPYSTAAPPA